MTKQIRLNLTLSATEEEEILAAYARYLSEGGKDTKNKWIKEIIMERLR